MGQHKKNNETLDQLRTVSKLVFQLKNLPNESIKKAEAHLKKTVVLCETIASGVLCDHTLMDAKANQLFKKTLSGDLAARSELFLILGDEITYELCPQMLSTLIKLYNRTKRIAMAPQTSLKTARAAILLNHFFERKDAHTRLSTPLQRIAHKAAYEHLLDSRAAATSTPRPYASLFEVQPKIG